MKTEQTKTADAVTSTDWVAELEAEAREQEKRRDALTQDDPWWHWHDGVSFGIKTALQHSGASSATIVLSNPASPK